MTGKRAKLFTHGDMDGCGCVIVSNKFFDKVDYVICDYDNVDTHVADFLDSVTPQELDEMYDYLLITDISLKQDSVVEMVDRFFNECKHTQIKLIDHHKTALWLNKFPWAWVIVSSKHMYGEVKHSGTNLVYRYLGSASFETYVGLDADIPDLVENIRLYDTWEWKDQKLPIPGELNKLFSTLGQDRFIRRFTENSKVEFSESEQLVLTLEKENVSRFINTKLKQVRVKRYNEYQLAIVFADRYQSDLGHAILNNFNNIHMAAMVDLGKGIVSFRTDRPEVDVAEFAGIFGGGGHKPAAGCKLIGELKKVVLSAIA